MAREQKTQTARTDDGLLDRRSYLKYAGAAAATVAVGAGASASVTAQSGPRTLDVSDGETIDPYLRNVGDGETVKIPPGTYELDGTTISADNWQIDGQGCTFVPQGYARLRLKGNGWQFGRVRFDTSGSNNLTVFPSGGDWKVHNCAWDGPNTGRERVDFLFAPSVTEGTTGVADQIWWGSGLGPNTTESAVKHLGDVNGEMWYKRCFFRQNGTYATETAYSNRSRGTANFEKCYAENCWHGSFRVGNDFGKTPVIRDCTVVYDDPSVSLDRNVRGVWAFWGDVRVENTDIACDYGQAIATSNRTASPGHKSGTVYVNGGNIDGPIQDRVQTTGVGSNPSKTPPAGCPTSVSEAVAGTTSGGSTDSSDDTQTPAEPEFPHALSVVADSSAPATYEFTVSDKIRKTTARGASVDDEDTIENGSVSGLVAGGTDSYQFAGKITSFTVDGNATIYLDGSQVAPGDVAESGSTAEPSQYSGTFVVDGTPQPRRGSTYEFTVDGKVKKDGVLASINPFDKIDGNTVTGRVVGGKDAYRIDGEITSLRVDGKARIRYVEE